MRSLLLFVLSLTLASSAFAQMPASTGSHVGAEARTKREFIKLTPNRQPASQPNAENFKLSYFDASLPTFQWVAPAAYGEYVLIDLGQRFTLPAESGFVDSVRIYFDTAWGARLAVILYPDSLYETGAGAFHLMNDFVEVETYGGAVIESEAIQPKSWVTFDMGHAPVPKEFFVRITPEDDGIEYISWYSLQTEQEPVRARTTENSRAAFYGSFGNVLMSAILDSTFYSLETDEILIGDFWMEAFVSVENASVSDVAAASIAMYPNPVSTSKSVRIENAHEMSSVVVTNMLGVEVARWDGMDAKLDLSTQGLSNGVYHVIVRTGESIRSEKLIVN